MAVFLVSQMMVEKWGNPMKMYTAIRKVHAASQAEAIGKFILDTDKLPFEKRIEPVDCFLLSNLKTIK